MKASVKIEIVIGMLLLGLTVILLFFGKGFNKEENMTFHQIISEENGQQKIVYVDESGKSVNVPDRPYSVIIKTKDTNGRVASEKYYNTNGQPVCDDNGAYGVCYEYDEHGFTVRTTYIDPYGRPINTNLGFASIKRVFNENGTMRNAFFYDSDDQPTRSAFQQFGYYREYDEHRRIILNTFLDENGEPMVGNTGYASVVTTYDEITGEIAVERYLDQNGNPIALAKGQYGIMHIGRKTVFLDVNGRAYFNVYNLFENYTYFALILAILVSMVSLFTSKRFNIVLLLVSVLFICYMTLMNRSETDLRTNFDLLWSYRRLFNSETLKMEILNNIWLFIPVGTILYRLVGNHKVIVVCVLLSAVVETVQYFTGLGLCELDDVISNTIGGYIGFILGLSAIQFFRSNAN